MMDHNDDKNIKLINSNTFIEELNTNLDKNNYITTDYIKVYDYVFGNSDEKPKISKGNKMEKSRDKSNHTQNLYLNINLSSLDNQRSPYKIEIKTNKFESNIKVFKNPIEIVNSKSNSPTYNNFY